MAISASMVKELRERTGAGMMECKKALVEDEWRYGRRGGSAAQVRRRRKPTRKRAALLRKAV